MQLGPYQQLELHTLRLEIISHANGPFLKNASTWHIAIPEVSSRE
jgi:hypothetical protein